MGASKELWMNLIVPYYRNGVQVGYLKPDGEIFEPEIQQEVKPFQKSTVYYVNPRRSES